MSINYVQFHIGDFLSGTMSMNTAEIGGYMMMITAHYNAGEKGLLDDEEKLRTITKCDRKTWNKIKDTILAKFYLENGYWKHKRVMDEIEKIKSKAGPGRPQVHKKNDDLGNTKSVKKCTTSESQLKNKSLKNNDSQKTNQKPITNNQDIKEKNTKKRKDEQTENDFEIFWSEYPNTATGGKGAKTEARTKFKKLITKGVKANDIIEGARRYRNYCEATDTYNKHAATFLNPDKQFWSEDWTANPRQASPTPNRKTSYMDELAMGTAGAYEALCGQESDFH